MGYKVTSPSFSETVYILKNNNLSELSIDFG